VSALAQKVAIEHTLCNHVMLLWITAKRPVASCEKATAPELDQRRLSEKDRAAALHRTHLEVEQKFWGGKIAREN
jgi:hypothetical protein